MDRPRAGDMSGKAFRDASRALWDRGWARPPISLEKEVAGLARFRGGLESSERFHGRWRANLLSFGHWRQVRDGKVLSAVEALVSRCFPSGVLCVRRSPGGYLRSQRSIGRGWGMLHPRNSRCESFLERYSRWLTGPRRMSMSSQG